MKQFFAHVSRGVSNGSTLVANLLLVVMLLAIGSQVLARFVLGAPTVWAEELARFLLVAITMLGSAALLEKNRHISINIVVDLLPRKAQLVAMWLRDTVTLIVCGLITYYGWLLLGIGARQTSTGLEVPMSVPYAAIPIGAALMALVLVASRAARAQDGV